jgi:3-methyladenine DNA glycosylase/8-oxoguanine DNA glycosylase
MKKFLLHRIREGEFNPSPTIQQTIDSLNKSYTRAKVTVERMHGNDEITLEESMTREFRYYSTEMQRAKQKQFEDEQKKMFELRKELKSIFEVDVWDEVIQNCEFDTLEEFYESYKLYARKNHV